MNLCDEICNEFCKNIDGKVTKTLGKNVVLYRGDDKANATQDGFKPKGKETDKSIWNVIDHCCSNKTPGMFISLTSSCEIAAGFTKRGYIYEIDCEGLEAIDMEALRALLKRYLSKIESAMNGELSCEEKNSLSYYKRQFNTAIDYSQKQNEVLIVGEIRAERVKAKTYENEKHKLRP